jgi:hypothetical protein
MLISSQSTCFLSTKQYEYEPIGTFVVEGQLPSLKNRKRLVYFGGKPRLIKSAEALEYQQNFYKAIPQEFIGKKYGSLDVDLAVVMFIYYKSRRPDLSHEMLFDCLEYEDKDHPERTVALINNDRYIREAHAFGFVDSHRPRTEFTLYIRRDKNEVEK